ncbi:MAG TPA: late competence development ComFB family protein [Syntrophomonadaceae bacterium]|nr:late competence development ComFB family protein [Syntrophomonadaceae bacterium]
MAIYNVVEQVVWSHLDKVMAQKANICCCELCRDDIAAWALNQLPPRYVTTALGEAYIRAEFLDKQLELDVIVALTAAVEQVSANPRHWQSLKSQEPL